MYYDDAHKGNARLHLRGLRYDDHRRSELGWSGDQIRFTGIDLEGQTVPTDTPELGWYEPDYVCTATWEFAN